MPTYCTVSRHTLQILKFDRDLLEWNLLTFGDSDFAFYIKRLYKMKKYFFTTYYHKAVDIIRFNTSTTG